MYLSLIAVILLSQGQRGLAKDSSEELSVAIRTAYEANKASFGVGSLRYRVVVGHASSLKELHRGNWTRFADTEASLVFDGGRARYECVYSAAVMAKSTHWFDDTSYSVAFTSERVITDGKQSLKASVDVEKDGRTPINTVAMEKGTRIYDNTVFSPLGLGGRPDAEYQLGNDLSRASQGRPDSVLSFRGDEKIADHTTKHLVLAWPGDGRRPAGRREYWVDLEVDATPRRIFEHADGQDYGTEFTFEDIRKIEGHGWLPFRQTLFYGDMKAGGKVKMLEVLTADFDYKPGAADFILKFDQPTYCHNMGAGLQYPPSRVWDLSRLPKLGDPGVERLQIQQPNTPAAPRSASGEREPRDWSIPVALAGVAFLSLAVLSYRKHRRG